MNMIYLQEILWHQLVNNTTRSLVNGSEPSSSLRGTTEQFWQEILKFFISICVLWVGWSIPKNIFCTKLYRFDYAQFSFIGLTQTFRCQFSFQAVPLITSEKFEYFSEPSTPSHKNECYTQVFTQSGSKVCTPFSTY